MPKLDKRLLAEVAETIIGGETALFLTPGIAGSDRPPIPGDPSHAAAMKDRLNFTDRVADRFRRAFIEKAMEMRNCAELTARKLLRPEGSNPSFIQMVGRETGWVFFHANEDMTAREEIGNPAFVYWPTEGADYQKIPYLSWRRERAGSVWRPVHMKGSLTWEDAPVVPARGARDAWAHLLDDDAF